MQLSNATHSIGQTLPRRAKISSLRRRRKHRQTDHAPALNCFEQIYTFLTLDISMFKAQEPRQPRGMLHLPRVAWTHHGHSRLGSA